MNFTLALLAGLVLLLPGITALVGWNSQSVNHGAKRPELQLTSVTALFLAVGTAALLHLLGYGLVDLAWSAAVELGERSHVSLGAIVQNPYDMAIGLALGTARPGAGSIAAFVLATLLECVLAWRLVASPGLDIVLEPFDVRSQGWVFQHVVRPVRHGYRPIAYILTTTPHGEYGIGYQGVVADIRQGADGELRTISLAEPERFVYQVVHRRADQPRLLPRLQTHDREWVGGIVVLDAAAIRNVVVRNVPAVVVDEVRDEVGDPDADGIADDGAAPSPGDAA